MPQKNRTFPYFPNSFYHVYNRGVNKQRVFWDDQDCRIFRRIIRSKLKEMCGDVRVGPFALMENHFHLLLYQANERDMSIFMKSVMIKYVLYIRKRHGWTGSLFESGYRAVFLPSQRAINDVRKYILQNPIEAGVLSSRHVGDIV